MRSLLILLSVCSLAGCAIKAVAEKSVVIPPSKEHVVVTVRGTAVCTDNGFIRRVTEQLDVKTSNGQEAK